MRDLRWRALLGLGVPAWAVDALAAGVAASLLVGAYAAGSFRAEADDVAATALLVLGGLAPRRVVPPIALVLVAWGVLATNGRFTAVDLGAFAIATYSMADSTLPRPFSLAAVTAVAGVVSLWFVGQGSSYAIVLTYVFALPPWIAGSLMRERSDQRDRELAAQRAAQEQRLHDAVADERRRLARDLHDTVTHHVGVMVVQAGGARQMLDRSPDRARRALVAVEDSGREALAELRQILGFLAEPSDPALYDATDLGFERITRMVDRVRAAGVQVEMRAEGVDGEIPERTWAIAYPLVQEALSNSMKHAGGAPAAIQIRRQSDVLDVEIITKADGLEPVDASTAPDGRGLVGLRSRVEESGGELDAGRRSDGSWAVRARIPIAKDPA
jgi:signal transduction histidine kinase